MRVVAAIVAVIGAVAVLGGLLNGAGPGATGAPPSVATRPSGSSTAIPHSTAAASSSTAAASSSTAAASSSTAAATPSADPVLIGAGDIARCDGSDDEATAALLEARPGIVFTLGDNAYDDGSTAQLRDCYGPSWGRVLDRTRFVVTGNHDIRTDDGAPEAAYFGDAAVRDGVTWFSEDVGAWHVIVLDANCGHLDGGCGADSAQVRWLRDDLATSPARCTLALWHQPRFSSGEHGNDGAVGPFWDALFAAGADLVLNGHDHDYERFAPQDPSGAADAARGITEMVVGTGGAALRGFGTTAANAIVRSSVAHGVIELTLNPTGWEFRFLSTDGSFTDQGTGTCH
jgi:3',5'-cyclic AMP phosphodiesterase CpdA